MPARCTPDWVPRRQMLTQMWCCLLCGWSLLRTSDDILYFWILHLTSKNCVWVWKSLGILTSSFRISSSEANVQFTKDSFWHKQHTETFPTLFLSILEFLKESPGVLLPNNICFLIWLVFCFYINAILHAIWGSYLKSFLYSLLQL